MNVTDPISDLLTRVRNASSARHKSTRIPGSKLGLKMAHVMLKSGYVSSVDWVDEGPQGWIEVELKYTSVGDPVIQGIRSQSTPGQRRYVKMQNIPKVLNGLGISILSTSKGVMTGDQAREASTGGELLATMW